MNLQPIKSMVAQKEQQEKEKQNTKFTQGEWEVDGNGIFLKGGFSNIAIVAKKSSSLEMEANAKLIAAAPDLLEALKDAYNDTLSRVNDGQLNRSYTLDKIVKAIKKATE